ncbi:GNAT family N-acetyltransferase [Methylosinus sp. RM1]|uniref:GNAT family N-acetyltransferase n=1 Tax=Methylosinus sp. RM1 TaxID=2583817 RepID=UPI00140C0155|nr:GNAT family N-acetyltransferase [Methylosinus sp. RM1]
MIGDESVRRYLADLANRLERLGEDVPKVWATLGISGDRIGEELVDLVEGSRAMPEKLLRLGFDRKTKTVAVRDGGTLSEVTGANVVLIDAAVHSGISMRWAADELVAAGASSVMSYSLVVKRTTEFVPNWFGLLIEEHDRPYFQLDPLPNNRFRKKAPFGNLRRLREDDVFRDPDRLESEDPSIGHITWGDLWYQTQTQSSLAYVYEINGRIKAFVHFKLLPSGILFLDAIGRDLSIRDERIGGVLMRWVETYARSSKCYAIELWSVENRVSYYIEKKGYERIADQVEMQTGGGEKLTKLRKRILYNIKPIELELDSR